MPAPAQRIAHGSLGSPVLTAERLKRTLHGMDEGELVFMCDRAEVYQPGGAAPGYPGLRILDVEERKVAGDVEATLRVRGLKSGNSRQVAFSWAEDPVGWDEASETRIVETGTAFTWGEVLHATDYPSMRLMGVGDEEQLDGRWATRRLVWRGIKKAGLVDRQITVNENVMSPEDPIVVLTPLEGGWTSPSTATVSLPRIVVTDTYKSTTAPDTTLIPGPLDSTAIAARSLPDVKTFSLSGSELRRQWPNGWKWASLDPQELYRGAGVWLHREVMEYVWEYTW